MKKSASKVTTSIEAKLNERLVSNSLRELKTTEGLIDFYSNDYLGFAKSKELQSLIESKKLKYKNTTRINGSTGSRLLSGNTMYIEELENKIAQLHESESALIYNSGYDANVGLLSCIATRHDTIIYDELAHASIIDGVRLSFSSSFSFRHNDIHSLEQKLSNAKGNKFVIVESIYSMDGDYAPLKEIIEVSEKFEALVIVDEAHATGVCCNHKLGRVMELGLQDFVWARVHTFGKAMGVHGAIIITNKKLKEFLINFSRSFIYTTALPIDSICAIDAAYEYLLQTNLVNDLNKNIAIFRETAQQEGIKEYFIDSYSPIQSIVIPGNDKVKELCFYLNEMGFDVRPILSPTVKGGQERLRICIHAFNAKEDIARLLKEIRSKLSRVD